MSNATRYYYRAYALFGNRAAGALGMYRTQEEALAAHPGVSKRIKLSSMSADVYARWEANGFHPRGPLALGGAE